MHDHVITNGLPHQGRTDTPESRFSLSKPCVFPGGKMEQIQHMIQNSSCGIKHKGPHNTNYSHGNNTWEKEYGPVK